MRLLLDTHIWLWSIGDRRKLSSRVVQELAKPENELFLSPLSVYEVIGMHSKGRLVLNEPVRGWLTRMLDAAPIREAQVTHAVATEASNFALPHGDPIDKLLVATARLFELTLVTADRVLIRSRAVAVLPNR